MKYTDETRGELYNGPAYGLTKAEHDRIVAVRGRSITQGPRTKRTTTSPHPDGGVVSVSDGLGHSRAESEE